jgi:methylthioribose-1-phosphate isomerase
MATPADATPPPAPVTPALAPTADVPAPPAPVAPDLAAEGVDVGRRRFFRLLAADVFQTAAQVVGVASVLQRTSAEAAASLLEDGSTTLPASTVVAAPTIAHRSPFRMDGDRLLVLDQGRFPFEAVEIECATGAEASRAIREMAVRGGPAVAQVAAYGIAITAARVREAKPYVRLATIRGTSNSLAHARIAPAALRIAVDRMAARLAVVGELADDGGEAAEALRAEADAIATEATLDHARLVEAGRAALVELVAGAEQAVADEGLVADPTTPADRPLGILTLGSTGALSGGQVGTALGLAIAYAAAGRAVHVFVLESRPDLDGARLAAWELGQSDVPHTVVVDAAIGWLLARGEVDVVLVGADRVARDGSVLGHVGTLPLALAAASAHVPLWACVPGTAIDPAATDFGDLPEETRPPIEAMRIRGMDVAASGTAWRDPIVDVTPAPLVDAFVTEDGFFRAPFEGPLTALAAAVAARAPVPRAAADAADPSVEAGGSPA